MFLGTVTMSAQHTVLRCGLCLFGLLISSLLWSGPISALCVATSMEGDWENAEPEGVLKRIELRFKCCDQVRCPVGGPCVTICNPDQDSVHVHGPCASGTCDWGKVVPDYSFVDAAAGFQYTRVDAHFQIGGENRRLVILLLGSDRLLVHWSIDYPEGSPQKDFSLIEYFERERCFTLMDRKVCLERVQRKFDPSDVLPRVKKK